MKRKTNDIIEVYNQDDSCNERLSLCKAEIVSLVKTKGSLAIVHNSQKKLPTIQADS